MRLLPVQIKMYMLAGEWLPFCEPDELPLAQRIKSARQSLVQQTGQNFGYDLQKWHDYLVEHHKGEYCWSNKHRSILVRIREAEADPAWREAVASLQAQ
jgi:hypothetical protein